MHADEPDVDSELTTETIQSYETADGTVFTETRNPNAWLQASHAVALADHR